jgi:hypothetical protein
MNLNKHAYLIDPLYAVCEQLRRDWANADLDDGFETRMVLAVLRHLKRYPDSLPASRAETLRYAIRLLWRFWTQTARRDYARRKKALERGALCPPVSLDLHLEQGKPAPSVDLYAPLRHDRCAGEWGRAVVQELVAQGMAREWAWVFVWRVGEACEWDEISDLL